MGAMELPPGQIQLIQDRGHKGLFSLAAHSEREEKEGRKSLQSY